VRAFVADLGARFRSNAHGLVVKENDAPQRRWKIRTAEYNAARLLRGDTPRRDYVWIERWSAGRLAEYLRIFPEETAAANGIVNRWKTATNDVYHLYVDVFKARTLEKHSIPPKYRPLVYGLHAMYTDELRPAHKSVDWKATVEFMNRRDTAQKLFVLNWEVREAAKQLGISHIPFEAPAVAATAAGGAGASAEAASASASASDAVTE
jgi:hypothetical protein